MTTLVAAFVSWFALLETRTSQDKQCPFGSRLLFVRSDTVHPVCAPRRISRTHQGSASAGEHKAFSTRDTRKYDTRRRQHGVLTDLNRHQVSALADLHFHIMSRRCTFSGWRYANRVVACLALLLVLAAAEPSYHGAPDSGLLPDFREAEKRTSKIGADAETSTPPAILSARRESSVSTKGEYLGSTRARLGEESEPRHQRARHELLFVKARRPTIAGGSAALVARGAGPSLTATRTVAERKVKFDGPGAALNATDVPPEIMYGQVAEKTHVPIQARIINGVEVNPPGRYPWMVGIVGVTVTSSGSETESFRCGGSLISPQYVLSASHCYFSTVRDASGKSYPQKRS